MSVSRSAPLRDQVYDLLETMIVQHTLKPGTRLVETELAERLGVSRNPVREAMTGLNRAGWVTFQAYAGAVVTEQTIEDAEDCFRVRTVLESEVARAAAERVRDGHSDAIELAKSLAEDLGQSGSRPRSVEDALLIQTNAQFHARFGQISGNKFLTDSCLALEKRVTWFYTSVGFDRSSDSWTEHAALLDVVLAGDPVKAATLMTAHIEKTSAAFSQRWKSI